MKYLFSKLFRILFLLGVVATQVACGGGYSESSPFPNNLLSEFGGGVSSGPTSYTGSIISDPTIGGLAAYGAPIVEGVITIYNADNGVVKQTTTTSLGAWDISVSGSMKTANPFPWIIKGEAAGIPTVWSIAFESDIGASGQSVNINSFTTAVLAAVGINIGDGHLDSSDIIALTKQSQITIAAAGNALSGILAEVFSNLPTPPNGNVFEQLRTTPFWGTSTGLDAVLDNVPIRIDANGKITISVPNINATVNLDPSSEALLSTQAETAKNTIDSAVTTSGSLLNTPPTLVAFDVQSSWGGATDTWSGFTGAATILSTKNYGKSTVIKFTSKAFPSAGWWGTSSMYDGTTGEMTLTLPEWTSLTQGTAYSVGFNGTAAKESFMKAVKTATGCRINGDPCVITFGSAQASDKGTLPTTEYFSAFGKFYQDTSGTLATITDLNKSTGTTTATTASSTSTSTSTSSKNSGLTTTTDTSSSTTTGALVSTSTPASYLVTVSSGGGWSTGFNGTITIKNTSTSPIANWSVSLPVHADAFDGVPAAWNGLFAYSTGVLTVKPATWAKQSLAAGETWSSGFNGGKASKWLDVTNTELTTFEPGTGMVSLKSIQDGGTQTTVVVPTAPIQVSTPTTSTSTASSTQNWQKDPGTTGSQSTTNNPCNSVRWGDVSSVSQACLSLMEVHHFGGPLHSNSSEQIALSNGKPVLEAFGYLVEWGVYGRKFGVENVAAAQYSKLLFSFLRVKPDGSLMITDEWASLQKDDTGTLLGLASDPFSSTWENQDRGIMKRLIMLKARFPHLKTAFSMGGWTLSGQFSSVTANPTTRANLVKSAIDFANKFGFEGIDIDWEYPVVGGNLDSAMPGVNYAEANSGTADDAKNYTQFLSELRIAVNNGGLATDRPRTKTGKIEVSIAVGLGPRTIDAVNFGDFIDSVDTVNLMAYDFNGGWSSVVSHNAPLYDNQGKTGPKTLSQTNFDQSEWNNHDAVLNILWNLKNQTGKTLRADGELGKGRYHKGDNGTTTQITRNTLMADTSLTTYRKKLILGIPFYGRGWSSSLVMPASNVITFPWLTGSGGTIGSMEKGVADAKDIIYARDDQTSKITAKGRASTWPAASIPATNFKWDPVACANFVWTAGNIFSYDDEDAIYHKAKYVKDNGLGGVMVWEVDGDTDDGKLAKAFVSGMHTGTIPPKGKSCAHATAIATQ